MSETKMYSVLDKWTDLEKENVVDFTSVDGVITEARVNGVPAGGGGGGTATLTVNIPSGVSGVEFYIPEIFDPDTGYISAVYEQMPEGPQQVEIIVPLNALLTPGSGSIAETSGAIAVDPDSGDYLITGNCSVTFGGGGD